MTTLLVGATGLLGPDICRHLIAAGHRVRALVRTTSNAARRQELAALGVELVEGDLKDPPSLARACAGVQAVVSTASSTLSRQEGDSIETVDRIGQLALVQAAKDAGVEHFVFVSFRDNPALRFPLTLAKRSVEAALKKSGMAFTIIQASYFMEIWLTPALGFDPAHGSARLYGEGTRPVSWVSARDVAHAAAAAVTEKSARNMVVEFGGPQALTPREVVRIFETAGAGTIATESVPAAALQAQMESATDALQQSFAGLMLQVAEGDPIDPGTRTRLFAFPMTSVKDFATATLAATRP